MDLEVTEVKFYSFMNSWRIELQHGLIVQMVKKKPSYKVGEKIVSLQHFYHYCDALNRFSNEHSTSN